MYRHSAWLLGLQPLKTPQHYLQYSAEETLRMTVRQCLVRCKGMLTYMRTPPASDEVASACLELLLL